MDTQAETLTWRFVYEQDLEYINKWGLNIFKVAEHSHNRPLTCVMYSIFQVSGLFLIIIGSKIKIKDKIKDKIKPSW